MSIRPYVARQEVVGDEACQRDHVGERRTIAEAGEMGLERDPRPAHGVAALAADRHDREIALVLRDLARGEADRVRVERAGQAAIRGDQDDQALAALALGEERMVLGAEDRGKIGEDLVELLGVRPRGERRLLGAAELRGGHELHRPRDLLDVADGADAAPDVALASHCLASSAPWHPKSDAPESHFPFRRHSEFGIRNRKPGGGGCPVRCRPKSEVAPPRAGPEDNVMPGTTAGTHPPLRPAWRAARR